MAKTSGSKSKSSRSTRKVGAQGKDTQSLSQFRNEELAKKAEKVLGGGHEEEQEHEHFETPSQLKIHQVKRVAETATPLEAIQSTSAVDAVHPRGCDAVALTIALTNVLGCAAIAFEAYAYSLDQQWNRVMEGTKELEDEPGNVFDKKTYVMNYHEYLTSAKKYALREQHQEVVFMLLLLIFVGTSLIHLCTCYLRFVKYENFSIVLIAIYAVGGAICILSTTFLISAITNIENNYMYAADSLFNFQHMFDNESAVAHTTDCKDKQEDVYTKGCPSYEYAKTQANQLEQIFRLCGDGSRYTRYYAGENRPPIEKVEFQENVYRRSDLKDLGFCSRDGFKFTAVLFGLLTGVVSSIVPIVYCCEGKAVALEAPMTVDEDIKNLPTPYLPKKFSASGAIREFRAYVEKESDEDAKDAALKPREVFDFKQH